MAGGFSVTISAEDRATKTIDAINASLGKFGGNLQKQMQAVNAPVDRMRASLAKLGETSGVNRMAASVRGMGRAASYTFGKMSELVPVLGVIGGAASVAGIQRMTSSWAEWGLKVSNTARQIGMGARQLTGLQGAANLAGGSADAMASGMQNLGQTMYDAIGGRNTEAIKMFNTLRIGFQDATGHARKAADVMPEIADKIASIRDPFARAQVGVTLFGGAWQGMEPLLVLGSKRIAELTRVSLEYGYVTDAGVEKAKDLELAQRKVGAAAEGLRNRIAERLAPILTPLLERFADWIAKSPMVTQAVEALGHGVTWLGDKLAHIDWDMLGKRAEEWGNRLKSVLQLLQRFGIVPDLSGIFGDGATNAPAAPRLPPGSPLATPDDQAAARAPDTRTFWERFYKPGPGLLDGVFGKPATNAQAPNGVPRTGPTFGPQSGATRSAVDPANANASRGIRNNNPLNLGFVPGQVGLVADAPSDGRFGRYRTMEDGVAAAERQLLKYQVRDHLNSVRQMVSKWAPPGENDTESYVQHVARSMGVDADAPISLNNQATAAAMIAPMAKRETGRALNPEVVNRGVAQALGTPLAAPQAAGAPMQLNTGGGGTADNGTSTVRVEFGGKLPDGMNMRVANPQKVDVGGPLVTQPQLLGAMP